MAKRRHSKEGEIGDLGEAQVRARLKQHKWKCGNMDTDLGEDLHVQIYEGGNPTGLSFYAQIKSTDNLNKYKLRSGCISYSIEVSDLLHWKNLGTPVFLIVWDINKQFGHWVSVSKAIKRLDKENKSWRSLKQGKSKSPKVQVHLEANNRTDDDGLLGLRLQVLKESQHVLENAFSNEFSICIPKDEESRPHWEVFKHGMETGASFTLSGDFLQLGEDEKRVLGPILEWPDKTIKFIPGISEDIFPIRLEFISNDGTKYEVPYLETRITQNGTKQFTVSNYWNKTPKIEARIPSPFKFSILFSKEKSYHTINFTTEGSMTSAREIEAVLPFINAFKAGGKFRWILLSNTGSEERVWHQVEHNGDGYSSDYAQVIKILALIEKKTKCKFSILDWKISIEDQISALNILDAIATGRVFSKGLPVSFKFSPEAMVSCPDDLKYLRHVIQRQAGYISMIKEEEVATTVELLGTTVSLGKFRARVTGRISLTIDELNSLLAGRRPSQIINIELSDTFTVFEYLNWLKS